MKTLTLDEIKSSELETLVIFRDFCREHHLRYYLTFGTLLGAARHKGFIPWDDDVDVFMPRRDYDYLIGHFNKLQVQNRELVTKENYPGYYLSYAKIIDRNTVLIEERQTLKLGVWIDVFPMDYLTDRRLLRRIVNIPDSILGVMLKYACIRPREGRPVYQNLLLRIINWVLPPPEWLTRQKNRLVKLITATSEESSTYGLLYKNFGRYGTPALPADMFEPAASLEFEGEWLNVPGKYDQLLRWFYGDYRKLPPVRKQTSRHRYTCYWREDE